MNHRVQTLIAPQECDADFDQIGELFAAAFPKPGRDARTLTDEARRTWQHYAGPRELAPRRFIVRDEGRIVANADVIPRKIRSVGDARELLVGGLKAVASHPTVRGHGFGRAVVQAAF